MIPASLPGAEYLAAYRQWMELEPCPRAERRARDASGPGGAAASIDLRGPVELAVLSVKQKAARCRLLGGDRIVTPRPPLGIFERMLWINPSDNQSVRFLIDEVRAKGTWENSRFR